MEVIVNNFIPFKGYKAINLFGVVFVRKDDMDVVDLNHEAIHGEQIRECLYIGFYILYFFEWLWKVLFKYPFSHRAYRDVSFEREAYEHEKEMNYIYLRKHYAMWKK